MTVVVVGLAAALYELAALGSWNRLPTISQLVRRLPVPARLGIVAVFAALLMDHFTTELVP